MREWRRIVGTNIWRLRKSRKLTQEKLAFEAEIDLTYMGGIERGVRNPSLDVLVRIANALEVLPADLLQNQQPYKVALRRATRKSPSTKR